MPEGLISQLGATKVQKFIMPGNRLADVDTVSAVFSPAHGTNYPFGDIGPTLE